MFYVTDQTVNVGHDSTLLNCEFQYHVTVLTVDEVLCIGGVIE